MRKLARTAAAVGCLALLANCAQSPAAEAGPGRAAATPAPTSAAAVSEADLACLAEAVYFEAGQGRAALQAVAHVVVNRARDPRFPRTVCGVVRDGCQFSYRCEGKSLTLSRSERRAAAYDVAEDVLAGAPDITGGALFFHSAALRPSGWFKSRPRLGTHGGNVFYR